MSEKYPSIGVATKLELGKSLTPGEGVAFEIQYGEDPYRIAFSNEEMDQVLSSGLEKMLGNQALGGFDYIIEHDDLPLFVGTRSIEIPPLPNLYHSPVMETNIVTMSHVHEQRGILVANRDYNGRWEFQRYDVQPPLRDWEEVFGEDEHAA